MNAKERGWEQYVDGSGKRHWRWPAPSATAVPAQGAAPLQKQQGAPVVSVPLSQRGRPR